MHNLSLGITLMFFASFFFAIMNALVKILSSSVSPVENLFFRSLIMVFFMLIVLKIQNRPLVKKKGAWGRLFFRAFIGGLSMLALFYNIATIPLGIATTFAQSTPLYAIVFSAFLLKEKTPIGVICASILGFVGVVFICNPFGESLPAFNILMGIFSGGGAALALITLRSLKEYFDNNFIILFFGLSMSITGGIILCLPTFFVDNTWHIPNLKEWSIIFLMGLAGTIGQYFMTKAYMNAPAGIISPIDYIKILWGILMGVYLGDALPSLEAWIGIFLILSSGILIALPVFIRDLKRIDRV
ncbi:MULTISPECIES: DMT family transporter [unclassified Helicobacter]|uniref:DMT family transporter n=1 Tax=unclassified Helicobacter TaxID=2593540 RepID=UPI000CF057BF|nr:MULTISPECIES: DMT family transporter [unclassified Helicobacter]